MDNERYMELMAWITPENTDTEGAHAEADRLVMAWLKSNGHPDIAMAWETAEKRMGGFWYA